MSTNLKIHNKNNAQATNVPNTETEYIENSAKITNVTQIVQNTFKTVREALKY